MARRARNDHGPLRLGVMAAVIKADHLLLIQRGDLKVWALPGGRLDSGERLEDAVAREVYEETGLRVQVRDPVGLYYLAGWQRMNVVFRAVPVGGRLHERTDESRAAGWFKRGALPAMPLSQLSEDAFQPHPMLRVVTTPPGEQRRLKRQLARRYLWNLLRGRPEPRWPHFTVSAAVVLFHATSGRVFTLRRGVADGPGRGHPLRTLPRPLVTGQMPPWQFAALLLDGFKLSAPLRWCGVYHDAHRDALEFVFTSTTARDDLFRGGDWSNPRTTPLEEHDAQVIDLVRTSGESVWCRYAADEGLAPGTIVQSFTPPLTGGDEYARP